MVAPKARFLPASRFVYAPAAQETVGALAALTVARAELMPFEDYVRFEKRARIHREAEELIFPSLCFVVCLLSVWAWAVSTDLVYVLVALLTAYVTNEQFALALEPREWIFLEAGTYPGEWPSSVLELLPRLEWLPEDSKLMVHVLVNKHEPELQSEWQRALLVLHLGESEWCIASWRPNKPLR